VSKGTRRSAGDTLLELLDKVPDAATLELLLEPAHLLRLLRAHGWSEEAIARDLTRGGLPPGELLLQVLSRQPDTRQLLDVLGNPAPRPPRPPGKVAQSDGGRARPIAQIVLGALITLPVAWYLFVRLDVIHAPGLARFFPSVYITLAVLLLGGLAVIGKGIVGLARR
jgi:hypothetical protein